MSQETFIVMAVESANINEADSLAQQLRSVLIGKPSSASLFCIHGSDLGPDAHEHNSDKSIMVYGLVTDFKVFHFGSYDPGKQVFALDRALVLRDLTTKFFLDDMARGQAEAHHLHEDSQQLMSRSRGETVRDPNHHTRIRPLSERM